MVCYRGYVDPKKYQLELYGCKLINKINAARKVNLAGKKDVCGWIDVIILILSKKIVLILNISIQFSIILLRIFIGGGLGMMDYLIGIIVSMDY